MGKTEDHRLDEYRYKKINTSRNLYRAFMQSINQT